MTETRERQVRVTFKRAVSDGSYGTESVELTLEEWVFGEHTDTADDSLVAEVLMARARRLVYSQLAGSSNRRVRDAVQPQPGQLVPDDDELPL